MNSRPCVYAPGPWGNCLDLGCRDRGGRCVYVGGRRGRTRCVCRIEEPSRNVADEGEEQAVEALELYRAEIAKVPACDGPDFSRRLVEYRAGDEVAGRAITGGRLGMALTLVESLPELLAGLTLLDTVQEANAGLVQALQTFTGTTGGEFDEHARRTIHDWLNSLDAQEA